MKKTSLYETDGSIDVLALRQALELTQQEFASILGSSVTTISRWEQQHYTPGVEKHFVLELVVRALQKKAIKEVVAVLGQLYAKSDLERVVALVHLGD